MPEIWENILIIAFVAGLMIFFMVLYFRASGKYKKLLINYSGGELGNNETNIQLVNEWTEQYQILKAQLELIGQISTVGLISYDYSRSLFTINENGYNQLGFNTDGNFELAREAFENMIHPDDILIYNEWFDCADIKRAEISDNPYLLRIKPEKSREYSQYLFRIKPVYSEAGNILTIVMGFIDTRDIGGCS